MNKTVSVTCPKCMSGGQFQTHSFINITKTPELRDDILNRSIFTYDCPVCKGKTLVAYDSTYIDTENKFAVALLTDELSEKIEGISAKEYKIRIVHSINSFIEKIMLFEDGIDDRVCELCKLFLEESYEEQNNAEMLAAYYVGRDIKNDCLRFFLIGNDAGNCETTLSMQSYRNILEVFEASKFNLDSETKIDSSWALIALKDGIFNIEE